MKISGYPLPPIDFMHAIRDQLLTTNELLSTSYLRNILHCDIDQAKRTLRRARQLYPDIKQVKILDKFAYYYLDSMRLEDLRANIEMKKNYIRIRFGRDNRIGHNWEAVVEWFIDKFTEGAEFQRQNHRRNIDHACMQKITLAQYASRMNIRLLRPADFNSKLREHGVEKKVTVQKICRVCKDEKDVRVVLDEIWNKPSKAQEVLDEAFNRNQTVFVFEKVLIK